MKQTGLEQAYNVIIDEQKGIVQPLDQPLKSIEFNIPHRPIMQGATSTKLHVAHDASAQDNPNAVSSNDCLYPIEVSTNECLNDTL